MNSQIITNTNDDLMVANTARVSFDKWNPTLDLSPNPKGNPRDPALIKYLADHKHISPFFHIRFTLMLPLDAIDLVSITDPTLLFRAVWSKQNNQLKFRHSYYGWIQLIRNNCVSQKYISHVISSLSLDSLQYSNLAYSLAPSTASSFLYTDSESDPAFIDYSVRIESPIPIARQYFTHRMLDTNEVSRRYVDEPPSFYYPTTYRSRPEGSIKQGSNPTPVTHLPKWVYYEETSDFTEQELIDEANNLATITQIFTRLSSTMYQSLVAANVAPEQARFFLLQSMETTFIATTSATYWSRILAARTDPHAQQEIQDSANQIHSLLTQTYPSFI